MENENETKERKTREVNEGKGIKGNLKTRKERK